uniref:Cytochrome P450 n=1 Tax=Elaeophora elaphi TaxID=1147741 RepID=A0A0R3RM10_9BILA
MLTGLLLLIVIFVLIIKYTKQIKQKIVQKWRLIRLINKLPGPNFLEILSEVFQFKLDREEFTYQIERIFRKYAYKDDHGMLCLWFGLRPTLLIARSPSAQVIFENTTLTYKTDDYDFMKRITGNGLLASSGETWFKARRILTPTFHFSILRKYVEIFNEQAKILVEILNKHSNTNETFDLLPYLRRYGLDVITETAMGVRINAQNRSTNFPYTAALDTAQEMVWARIRYPWYWFAPIRWLTNFDRKLDHHCNICKKFTKEVIAAKKKEWEAFDNQPSMDDLSAGGKNILSFLDFLLSIHDQYNLTDDEMCNQVNTIMAAGSDATSAQVGFNLFALGHRQHYQEKAYEEIKRVLGETERDITVDDVKELKYLYQCICETSRITPNVVVVGRKIHTDLDICGHTVPAGTTCYISLFAIMRDPKHYDNPEEYDPEHFAPEKVKNRDPFAFVPFSAGIRNCIGNRFAVLELLVTLAYILRRYRIISMLPEAENRPIPEFSLKPSKGFPIRLETR